MLFSSTTFLFLFLPAVLLGYYVLFRWSRGAQNVFLFFASLLFYAWGEPKFVLVMLLSIVVNWAFGLLIDRRRSRGLLALDICFNLAILFLFKYLGFAGRVAGRLFGISAALPEIALPIGISFFTFQAMSYVIDVYRQKGGVQKNLLSVGLYISFFPQLIAGPIVRYETIADQIRNRVETAEDFFGGFARFVVGLAKKVLLANSFAVLADKAFATAAAGEISAAFSWLGAIAYTLQIFFDFGGYSDMAIGLGRMFGFHFLENFRYPYLSTSVSEFWRRWHISLGTWFRDYVYIPLGGSRRGLGRTLLNLLIVWSLTGLWHGANYTFVVWGLMYFVLLAMERLTHPEQHTGRVARAARWVYTMLFVTLGWVIFRADSIGDAAHYLAAMFGFGGAPTDGMAAGYFAQSAMLLLIGVIACTPLLRRAHEALSARPVWRAAETVGLTLLFILSVASLVSSAYNPFIYFNF